jgi:hypothetical protein
MARPGYGLAGELTAGTRRQSRHISGGRDLSRPGVKLPEENANAGRTWSRDAAANWDEEDRGRGCRHDSAPDGLLRRHSAQVMDNHYLLHVLLILLATSGLH